MTTVEVLKAVRPELRWTPIQGEQTTEFLERKRKEFGNADSNALDSVLLEAQTILGRCVPPNEKQGTDTGLVVGYVQSGKTLSFTTVMALARDNHFQLVILIAGIAVNLKNQSERRLGKDLGLDETGRAWTSFENPKKQDAILIQNALAMWSKKNIPEHKRRAVIITVLKNHTRLKSLVATLKALDLQGVPTLIIDDEGDQASLNTKTAKNRKQGTSDASATYEWVVQLKSVLPHHTFLQYTATPQANLLIGIADVLSPSFAETVTPGSGYVGGNDFFKNKPPLVSVIPAAELPSDTNVLCAPPPTLQSALRFFLLGAAIHTYLKQRGNRSMMVHPSQKTGPHTNYKQWVDETTENWKQYLNLPEDDPAYLACEALFMPEYQSLEKAFPEIPAFKELMGLMSSVLLETRIVQVNSTKQGLRDVQWNKSDYWILVGGQKLDRGFTVEGLTVTYMPRPIGSGNADTLQQRARFFGYKKNYRGLCRVFITLEVKEAFEKYVEHEEFVRKALEDFRGRPLIEWKRDFILTKALNPTRASVIGLDVSPVIIGEDWIGPKALYKSDPAVEFNRKLWTSLAGDWGRKYGTLDAASTYPEFKDIRAKSPRNILIEGVPLQEVLENFMLQLRISDMRDSETHTALLLTMNEALVSHPDDLCDVFLIGDLISTNQHRSILVNGTINQVFQGKTPNRVTELADLNYVGDRALFTRGNRPTLHLRMFDLKAGGGLHVEMREVPWYALHLPSKYGQDVIVESRDIQHAEQF